MKRSTPEDFWRRLKPTPNGCLEFQGCKRQGYGRLSFTALSDTRYLVAHHVAWALTYGALPEPGSVLHHVCGNPACCNVEHLEQLTYAEHHERHHLPGCKIHGEQDWTIHGTKGRCRICDRNRKREQRRLTTSSA